MTIKNILIVEDEQDIAQMIKLSISDPNYSIQIMENGASAIEYIQANKEDFDLFILDRMLPGTNGIEICKFIRMYQKTKTIPVLMITALSKPEDIIEGLDQGADDYITKPFDLNVLNARVKALLRRSESTKKNALVEKKPILVVKGIKIDTDQFKVWKDDQEIELTLSEFKLLAIFLKEPGKVFTRNQLVELIQDGHVVVTDRTIDTHIFGLRKKLDEYATIIETIRGIGYRAIAINE